MMWYDNSYNFIHVSLKQTITIVQRTFWKSIHSLRLNKCAILQIYRGCIQWPQGLENSEHGSELNWPITKSYVTLCVEKNVVGQTPFSNCAALFTFKIKYDNIINYFLYLNISLVETKIEQNQR